AREHARTAASGCRCPSCGCALGRAQGRVRVALEAANRLCDGDFGSLYMVEGDVLRPTAQRGGSVAQAEYERTHPHTKDRHTLVGRVAVTEQAVHIPDVLADPE